MSDTETNYSIHSISDIDRKELFSLCLLKQKRLEYDKYDISVNRYIIEDFSDEFVKKVISIINKNTGNIIPTDKSLTFHYIRYKFKTREYILDEHNDGCDNTLLVYLKKDVEIEEKFFVRNKQVDENYWKEGALLMKNKSEHSGIFKIPKRDRKNYYRYILSFFWDN